MPRGIIKVEVAPSQMRAFVSVQIADASSAEIELEFPTTEQILQALRSQSVTFGIIKEALARLVMECPGQHKTLIAQGVDPLHGEDGGVEYFFDITGRPHPHQNEDGTVDYHEIGLIHGVEKDQVLARVLPPKNGIPGTNVCGAEVAARAGTPAFIQAGPNTYFSDAKKLELRAQVAGAVTLARGIVNVDQTYTIDGDVDYTVGNVHFPGSVVIRGDVKTGFKVQAAGRIEVRGVVEDALIEAQGDVLIKGGFEGSGRGVLRSQGTVHLKFVENQVVEAAGSVHIGEDALNAHITSGGTVYVTTGIGAIIGGIIRAQGGVTAKVLGCARSTPTRLEIFQEEIPLTELESQEQKVVQLQTEITGMAPVITALQRRKTTSPAYAPEIDAELNRLVEKLQPLRSELDQAEALLQDLKVKVEKAKTGGKIHVLNCIHPGVEVNLYGLRHVFDTECGKTIIKKSDLELIADSLQNVAAETSTNPTLELVDYSLKHNSD